MKRLDIRARVLLAAIIPATLIAVLLAWYFTRNRIADLETSIFSRGNALIRQLAVASEYGVFSGNRERLRQLADSTMREADLSGVAILDAAGEVLAARGRLAGIAANQRPLPGSAGLVSADRERLVFSSPVGQQSATRDDPFDKEVAAAPESIALAPPLGSVVIEVSRADVEARKRDLVLGAAAITLMGLLLAGLLARWLAQGVTNPVLELADTVAEIERGNLSARADVRAGGVLKVLESGINEMAVSLTEARDNLEARIAVATAELHRQKDRAELANRTKTQFLAAASHDLRQPLQALGMFSHALRRRVTDPATIELVEGVGRGVDSLESVIEALLDISKLDAGAVTPRLEDLPLGPMLANIRDTFRPTAQANGLDLVIVPTAAWVRSDPLLLMRILSNLVSNALRYTARGGVVVGCRRRGPLLGIEVWDSGRGIEPEKQQEIFREFIQIGRPERAHDKGLGLGLAIVDRLCHLLEHPLRMRSVLGKGTVFEVLVPRVAAVAALPELAAADDDPAPLAGRRVLLVDDERDVLLALAGYLELRGAELILASSSREAEAALRGEGGLPDLVVTDYRLGNDDDGVTLLNLLRARYGPSLPGIILTGESSPETLRILAGSGYPMLSKPVHPQDLESLIAQVLRGTDQTAA
jgi:signal transduction histidine kinase/ActR/RegA family two-component response regulator